MKSNRQSVREEDISAAGGVIRTNEHTDVTQRQLSVMHLRLHTSSKPLLHSWCHSLNLSHTRRTSISPVVQRRQGIQGNDKQPNSEHRVGASGLKSVFILMQVAVIFMLVKWCNWQSDKSRSHSQKFCSCINRDVGHLSNLRWPEPQMFNLCCGQDELCCASDFEP